MRRPVPAEGYRLKHNAGAVAVAESATTCNKAGLRQPMCKRQDDQDRGHRSTENQRIVPLQSLSGAPGRRGSFGGNAAWSGVGISS